MANRMMANTKTNTKQSPGSSRLPAYMSASKKTWNLFFVVIGLFLLSSELHLLVKFGPSSFSYVALMDRESRQTGIYSEVVERINGDKQTKGIQNNYADVVSPATNKEESTNQGRTIRNPLSPATNKEESTNQGRTIRKWGCDRTETPLIFVHNGKMGGGGVRARLAASATNYSRGRKWKGGQDSHYYPISMDESHSGDDSSIRKGSFCNNRYKEYTGIPDLLKVAARHGKPGNVQPCTATTPFGIAIACPHPYKTKKTAKKSKNVSKINGSTAPKHYKSNNCHMCDDDYYLTLDYYFDGQKPMIPLPKNGIVPDPRPPGHTCDVVYTSHNSFGSEVSWLPPRYLKEHFWDKSQYKSSGKDIKDYWTSLLSDREHRRQVLEQKATGATIAHNQTAHLWCPDGYPDGDGSQRSIYDRPATDIDYRNAYQVCGKPLAEKADNAFRDNFFGVSSTSSSSRDGNNYSPFYTSIPLHRVTMFRDPWSWVISKFFWHNINSMVERAGVHYGETLPCENITFSNGRVTDPMTRRPIGWLEEKCMGQLIRLCGNDCHVRYERGMMTLEEIEAQAESNLRNGFSVVGLLNETDSFYDMVTDRIGYVNLTNNINVTGAEHSTRSKKDQKACKELFTKDKEFQETVRQRIPAFEALERLYHVAIEVNRFQKEEIDQCRRSKGKEPTKGVYNGHHK